MSFPYGHKAEEPSPTDDKIKKGKTPDQYSLPQPTIPRVSESCYHIASPYVKAARISEK
jgi:hypothetical protein